MIVTGFISLLLLNSTFTVTAKAISTQKQGRTPVWHTLVAPAETLRDAINKVAQWVKTVEGTWNMTLPQGVLDQAYQ